MLNQIRRASCLLAALICGITSIQATAALPAAETVDLRGYGKVTYTPAGVTDSSGIATFECQDERHAEILQSKLQADLTWDRLLGPQLTTLPPGIPAYQRADGSLLALARQGSRVQFLFAPDAGTLQKLLQDHHVLDTAIHWRAEKRHPYMLDYFDLESVDFFDGHLGLVDLPRHMGYTQWYDRYTHDLLAERYAFWNRIGLTCGANLRLFFGSDNKADSLPHTFPLREELTLLQENKTPVSLWLGPHQAPWWFRNKFPDQVSAFDPYALWTWNSAYHMGNAFPAKCLTPEAAAYLHRFDLTMLETAQKNAGDWLTNIRVASGTPGDEDGFHGFSTELMGYSPVEEAAFRHWLQTDRHLDLAALGQRWYGDSNHFASWDQVTLPSRFEFFGGFGHDTFDILTDWQFHPDSSQLIPQELAKPDYQPGPDWLPVDLAPSVMQKIFVGDNPTWFRKTFSATEWLAHHQGQRIFIVANTMSPTKKPVDVYLNGTHLGAIADTAEYRGAISVEATKLLRPGENLLVLRNPVGTIHGPVFLTAEEPRHYPELGTQQNARWVDYRDWLAELVIRSYRDAARPMRERAPELPFQFVPGNMTAADHFLELKRDIGITSIHFTGGGSSYNPWWRGLGYVLKTYGSSEEGEGPGEPSNVPFYNRELAWMLLDAIGHHTFYDAAPKYIPWEKQTHWFADHRRMISLLGKSLRVPQKIAILRSAGSERYLANSMVADSWDLGRGPLQVIHYDNVYTTETELRAGLVKNYPVLIDSNSLVLDDSTIQVIEEYVRAGGTFVALNMTGQNNPTLAHSWPISRLTGFNVLEQQPGRRVQILAGNPLLRQLAGQWFPGEGHVVDWQGVDRTGPSLALVPHLPGTTILARWEDGRAAIGMRKLGQGRVIVLGSTFWRDGSDLHGSGMLYSGSRQDVFLNDLLSGLGLSRDVQCDAHEIWARRQVTKNGLQEWFVTYNTANHDVAATLNFPCATEPRSLIDVETGQKIPFTFSKGIATLNAFPIPACGLRVLAMDRPTSGDIVNSWFAEKKEYWPQLDLPVQPAPIALPPAGMQVLEKFRFRMADDAVMKDLQWTTATPAGAEWRDMREGFWDESGLPAHGIGLYRCQVTLPSAWQNHRMMLGFLSFDYPVFMENATVYINGRQACVYKGRGWANYDSFDVTSLLHEGTNDIAIRVDAPRGRGSYIGQCVIYPLETLESPIELKDGWQIYQNTRDAAVTTVPINGINGRFVQTSVDIPTDWKAKSVFLEVECDRLVMAFINGRPLTFNNGHPVNGTFQAALGQLIEPGRKNSIALFTYNSQKQTDSFVLKAARLGLVRR